MKNGTRHSKAMPVKILAPAKRNYGPSCEKCKNLGTSAVERNGVVTAATTYCRKEMILGAHNCLGFDDASIEKNMSGGLLGVRGFRA